MSTNVNKKCYMVPVIPTTNKIFLPDGIEVRIGRSSLSGITDINCSKEQILVKADYNNELVSVKSIGRTPSHFKGKPMAGNETYCLRPDSVVEIVPGKTNYKVSFTNHKRLSDQSIIDSPLSKKIMTYQWKVCGSGELLMCISPQFDETKTKVASFDLDGTLIKTKSGRVFAKDSSDWMLWDRCVKNVLINLGKNNYKIVLFTNQAGLGTVTGKSKLDGFKTKIEKIIDTLQVPIQVFVAITNGLYRKPSPGMWFFMKMRREEPIDLEQSFYVGDAAGRPENWKAGKKADFAVSDRMFAMNIGIKFYTPEEYFLNEPMAPYAEFKFHPWDFDKECKMPDLGLPSAIPEVILMVGSPGSGKSHFVKHHILPHGYKMISRDKLGSCQRCVRHLKNYLQSKKSTVIDNTNPDRISRQRFIEVCAKYNIKVRCFFMDTTLERCLHNNKFREIVDSEHAIITAPLITTFHSNYERPTVEEGFFSVIQIPFLPYFDNDEQEFFYNCYLTAK